MMRDLIREGLKSAGLLSAFEQSGTFEAALHFGTVKVLLAKTGTQVTLSGESPEGPISVRYCVDRNWLPLSFCLGADAIACDQDDLWERSELSYVLGNDAAWAKHLSVLGFTKAEQIG